MSHTPTPWTMEDQKIDTDIISDCSFGYIIRSKHPQERIYDCTAFYNAELIITAVNSHYELLEAAEAAISYIFDSNVKNPMLRLATLALEQAIKKAKTK